jgi:hypothetical protein
MAALPTDSFGVEGPEVARLLPDVVKFPELTQGADCDSPLRSMAIAVTM